MLHFSIEEAEVFKFVNTYIYLYNESKIKIWGLTPGERIARIAKQKGNITIVHSIEEIPNQSYVILLNCRFIIDERIVDYLKNNNNVALTKDNNIVAIAVESERVKDVVKVINNEKNISEEVGLLVKNVDDSISTGFYNKLKKVDKPIILDTEKDNLTYISKKLFYGSYKGVTDIITRLVWPKPAMLAVKFCVKHHITPNQVTLLSLLLAILVGALFYINQYFIGLVLAWFMTFLDTVDGKLARVTITSTEFGNRLDHGIDIVHPLYWYACWAYGLDKWDITFISINECFLLLVIFYIIGRLSEGFFQYFLKAPFSIFCWRPFDSYFRLIAARRNPNLIILTISAIFNAQDIGIFFVSLWTIVSSMVMIVRMFLAYKEKKQKGQLSSWLAEISPEVVKKSKIYKLFIY
jgi:phosphatidylglycerophosphate synthase